MKLGKKGQNVTIQYLATAAIIFLVAAITVSIGADVLQDFREDDTTTTNSVVGNISLTGVSVAANSSLGYTYLTSTSSIVVYNGTASQDLVVQGTGAAANYTIYADPGHIQVHNNNWTTLNISEVRYLTWTASRNVTGGGIESMNELGGWFQTIALVVAAVVILGLLFGYFGRYAR